METIRTPTFSRYLHKSNARDYKSASYKSNNFGQFLFSRFFSIFICTCMGRKSLQMTYPHLNDCGGDLNKKWYVEYSFRLPNDDKKHVFRNYDGLCSGTAAQRRNKAAKIIAKLTEYLKSGEYLNHESNYSPVRQSDTHRPEVKMYQDKLNDIRAAKVIKRFLAAVRPTIRPKTYSDYSGKLDKFRIYVEEELGNKPVTLLQKVDILPFFESLSVDKDLCRRSIEKYEQIVRALYLYMEDVGLRQEDTCPLKRLPKYGKVIDVRPMPFTDDERQRLKNAIKPVEPYLWLACEIQYYCAIRPGTELRLCKVGYIDRQKCTLTVPAEIAKAKRTDVVGIPPALMAEMENLGIFSYPDDYYIFGKYGVPSPYPLGHNTQRNRFNYYREALHIPKSRKFYSWKHTGAISAANNGMPIMEMKDYLRHKDIETTMQYLHNRVPTVGKQADYIDSI